MPDGLWIIWTHGDGVTVLDGAGAPVARAMLPALPEPAQPEGDGPLREASRREKVALAAMAVRLRSWLLSQGVEGRVNRLALVGPEPLRAPLELRLADGQGLPLVASVDATPLDGAGAVAAARAALMREAA